VRFYGTKSQVKLILGFPNTFLLLVDSNYWLRSVLYSFQVCWSQIFILAKKVIRAVERKFNRFLWNGSTAKSKVSWDLICMPKKEGWLGFKKLEVWNRAVILKHIRKLFAKSGSLWVAWVEKNLIKRKCFWLLKMPQKATWSWRKILTIREVVNFLF
jgi:hypothetical protein